MILIHSYFWLYLPYYEEDILFLLYSWHRPGNGLFSTSCKMAPSDQSPGDTVGRPVIWNLRDTSAPRAIKNYTTNIKNIKDKYWYFLRWEGRQSTNSCNFVSYSKQEKRYRQHTYKGKSIWKVTGNRWFGEHVSE